EYKPRPNQDQTELRIHTGENHIMGVSLQHRWLPAKRNPEEPCVCTHAKAPARYGLGLALGMLVLLLTALGNNGFAQDSFSVNGKVISATDGKAIEGATVTNKRTRIHAVTDRLGEYRIPARPDDMLIFSFVGYVTAEEDVNGSEQIIVALETAANTLEEVENNAGCYTTTRRLSTGSIRLNT